MNVGIGREVNGLALVSELPGMLVKVILSPARMSTESTAVRGFVLSLHCTVSWYMGSVEKLNVGELV